MPPKVHTGPPSSAPAGRPVAPPPSGPPKLPPTAPPPPPRKDVPPPHPPGQQQQTAPPPPPPSQPPAQRPPPPPQQPAQQQPPSQQPAQRPPPPPQQPAQQQPPPPSPPPPQQAAQQQPSPPSPPPPQQPAQQQPPSQQPAQRPPPPSQQPAQQQPPSQQPAQQQPPSQQPPPPPPSQQQQPAQHPPQPVWQHDPQQHPPAQQVRTVQELRSLNQQQPPMQPYYTQFSAPVVPPEPQAWRPVDAPDRRSFDTSDATVDRARELMMTVPVRYFPYQLPAVLQSSQSRAASQDRSQSRLRAATPPPQRPRAATPSRTDGGLIMYSRHPDDERDRDRESRFHQSLHNDTSDGAEWDSGRGRHRAPTQRAPPAQYGRGVPHDGRGVDRGAERIVASRSHPHPSREGDEREVLPHRHIMRDERARGRERGHRDPRVGDDEYAQPRDHQDDLYHRDTKHRHHHYRHHHHSRDPRDDQHWRKDAGSRDGNEWEDASDECRPPPPLRWENAREREWRHSPRDPHWEDRRAATPSHRLVHRQRDAALLDDERVSRLRPASRASDTQHATTRGQYERSERRAGTPRSQREGGERAGGWRVATDGMEPRRSHSTRGRVEPPAEKDYKTTIRSRGGDADADGMAVELERPRGGATPSRARGRLAAARRDEEAKELRLLVDVLPVHEERRQERQDSHDAPLLPPSRGEVPRRTKRIITL